MADRDYEKEASEQGWTPKEDWKGDEAKWTDAKTFVERGEKIAGILKSKVERLEGKVENLTESNRKFGEYHKQTIEAQRKSNVTRITALEAELAQAVTDGDGGAYTRANAEINDLKTELPPDGGPDQAAQAWNVMAGQWVSENQWYNTNPTLATFADGLQERIMAEGYNGRAYFSELTRRVKEAFPDEFKNPRRDGESNVEAGGQISTGDSQAQTYENMDAEAKKACDGFVKDGFVTRKQYVAEYYAQ